MRTAALLSCLLLASTAAHALPVRPEAPAASTDQIFGLPLPAQGQIDERALYYSPGTGGGRELKFDVRVNGRPYLDEKLTLPAAADGATFQLLAGDTVHLDRLFKLAGEPGNRLRVNVLLDGRSVRSFSFQEFLDASRGLQQLPLRLGTPASIIRTFSPEAEPPARPPAPRSGLFTKDYDQACVNSCESERTYCVSTQCPQQFVCETCDNQYQSCVNSCYVCTDPRSVAPYTTSYVTNVQSYGWQCRHDWPNGGKYYDQYYVTVRTDHYQRTTYCDGHTVDTYSYSTTSSGWCEHPTYSQCSFPNGYAYNVCY